LAFVRRKVFADGLVAKKISSIGDSRDCQSGSSINRTTRMIRLVPALEACSCN
jgi:hypothetical protein